MEIPIKPDRKFYTKCNWILLTISVTIFILSAIIHLIISVASGDMQAVIIIWIFSITSVCFMWIISYPIIRLWIKNLAYIIYDDRVTIHKGIITKTQQNIPFRAITDFALERTIYDRILGIGAIKIQTAGQSHSPTGYEGKLYGLIEYDNLNAELREKVKHLHPVSESLTTAESATKLNEPLLNQILSELRVIKQLMEKR